MDTVPIRAEIIESFTVFAQNSQNPGSVNNEQAEDYRERRKRASQCPETDDAQGEQSKIESARRERSARFRLFYFRNSVVFHDRRYHAFKKGCSCATACQSGAVLTGGQHGFHLPLSPLSPLGSATISNYAAQQLWFPETCSICGLKAR